MVMLVRTASIGMRCTDPSENGPVSKINGNDTLDSNIRKEAANS